MHNNKPPEDLSQISDNLNVNIQNWPSMNYIDCFSKKLKKLKNGFFNYQSDCSKESLEFKFNFYKSLPTCTFTKTMNTNLLELNCLRDFSKKKPFKIIDCDKNIGVCFIGNDCYNKYVEFNLSDNFFKNAFLK